MDKETLDLVFMEHLQQCTRDIIERCILLTRKEPEYSKMKREGVEFTCDRCGMKAFVEYSNGNIGLYEEPKGWSTAAKDPTNLKQLGKNISNLCPQCTEEYKKLAESFQLMGHLTGVNICEENC